MNMKNNDLVNTREARAAREDAELEELIKARDAASNPLEEDQDDSNKEGFSKSTPKKEGTDWEDRYNNLRSYSHKKENELNKRISELEKKMHSNNNAPPSDPAEFEAWANEFPDVVRMLKTVIRNETGVHSNDDLSSLKEEVNKLKFELSKEKAFAQLTERHSDWRQIVGNSQFMDWLEEQRETRGRIGQAMWDAINTNDFDISAAANVFSEYKEKNKKTEARKAPERPSAAFATPQSRSTAPSIQEGKRTFTEDEIESMSQKEYEKLEDEITLALKEGRVLRRVGGGALM